MERHFTLEYWMDDEWYVGKLKEVPGVFSQGATLDELETNIRDAYHLMGEFRIPSFVSLSSTFLIGERGKGR